MTAERAAARALADAFLAGEWTPEGLVEAARTTFGRRRAWFGPLARAVLTAYPRPPHDRPRELAAAVHAAHAFERAAAAARRDGRRLSVVRWTPAPTAMVRHPWPVPRLDDLRALADLLGTDVAHLAWLADARGYARRTAPGELHQYRHLWVDRPGRVPRLLEAPRSRLLRRQRVLLDEVLGVVPAHEAAHGFVAGRGVRSATAPHAGAAVLLRLDLRSFFASVTAPRVYGVFRSLGYPEPVAHELTALVTHAVPGHVLAAMPRGGDPGERFALRRLLRAPHLPAGAPTSPALANLVAYRLDARIAGYARAAGATYSRYADDLVLSGGRDLLPALDRLRAGLGRIVAEEGFELNAAKTRVRTASQRQQVLGVVVNARPTVPRPEYDRLRAVLHNARRTGGEAQNREGHPDFRAYLQGRVAWVASVDPARGARLRAAFDEIRWADPP